MRRVAVVISALLMCGIVWGCYGAAFGAIYSLLLAVSTALREGDAGTIIMFMTYGIGYGVLFGFTAGFISGVLGVSLGGPIGCGIGGILGTSATMLLCFGKLFWSPPVTLFVVYPSIWGGVFGLVFGLHIFRRVPVLPGARCLAESIYSSPLGGWLGWQRR